MKIYDLAVKRLDGHIQPLREYENKVLLIVNTASQCGFTPQYKGLQQLYEKYQDSGFEILGFPCNQFGGQEPGTNSQIQQFCTLNYGVDFPMFAKINVNGPDADPLYQYLKKEARGVLGSKAIKWNFTKFVADRKGNVVKRFAPNSAPEKLEGSIQRFLNQK